jgi:hypothetical protein
MGPVVVPLGLIVTTSSGRGRVQPDHVSRLGSSSVFFDGEFDPFAFFQGLESASPDSRIVDEDILALVERDEPVAPGMAEPFDNAGFPLGFHFSPPYLTCGILARLSRAASPDEGVFPLLLPSDRSEVSKQKPSGMEGLDGL